MGSVTKRVHQYNLMPTQTTLLDCDIALAEKLHGVHVTGSVYIEAFRLKKEVDCYKRARAYTVPVHGPKSDEQFDERMQHFSKILTDSETKHDFSDWINEDFGMNLDTLWPDFSDEDLVSHGEEIRKVPAGKGAWNREIEYVSFDEWKLYEKDMWDKFFRAFRGPEKKKIIVAVPVGHGGGGDTKPCHTCDNCFWMQCKSTWWSFVHSWDYFFQIPESHGFIQDVDLFFYDKNITSFSPPVPDVHTLVLHLQDASYSGDQILHLTGALQAYPPVIHVGMTVVGKNYGGEDGMDENPHKATEFSKSCTLSSDRCFIFGKVMESALSPRTCIRSPTCSFEHGAHFLVQHKAADDISLGKCWHWYQFLGIFTPYSRDHRLIEVQADEQIDVRQNRDRSRSPRRTRKRVKTKPNRHE